MVDTSEEKVVVALTLSLFESGMSQYVKERA